MSSKREEPVEMIARAASDHRKGQFNVSIAYICPSRYMAMDDHRSVIDTPGVENICMRMYLIDLFGVAEAVP
jgi:hypothetical protein